MKWVVKKYLRCLAGANHGGNFTIINIVKKKKTIIVDI